MDHLSTQTGTFEKSVERLNNHARYLEYGINLGLSSHLQAEFAQIKSHFDINTDFDSENQDASFDSDEALPSAHPKRSRLRS